MFESRTKPNTLLFRPFEIAAFKYSNPNGRVIILPVEMGMTIAYLVLAGVFKAVASEIIVWSYLAVDSSA